MTDEQIEERFDKVDQKLDVIDKAIRGEGDKAGLAGRVGVLEDRSDQAKTRLRIVWGALVGLVLWVVKGNQ